MQHRQLKSFVYVMPLILIKICLINIFIMAIDEMAEPDVKGVARRYI